MRKPLLAAVLLCMLCVFTAKVGAAPEDPILSFPVISDIHVQNSDSASKTKFRAAMQDLHNVNPASDVLVINGDLGNGQPADYRALSGILNSLPHPPLFFTIGNHEFYKAWFDSNCNWSKESFPNGESDQDSIKRFLEFTAGSGLYHDSWIKDYHFIFLGSEQYRQTNPNIAEDAYLSDNQLSWLKDKLAVNADPGKPIFVFLHQPLPNTVTGSSAERGVVQHKELKEILDAYPQVVFFSSHTHYQLGSEGTLFRDRFTMVNTSSVNEPWSIETQGPLKGNYSEGLVVQVYKSGIVIRGRDFVRKTWIPSAQYLVPVTPSGDRG